MSKYLVWSPELNQSPEDGRFFRAQTPAEAACQWAERFDADAINDSDLIADCRDVVVIVRDVRRPVELHELIVGGESVPKYWASLLQGQAPLGAELEAIWDANVAGLYES